MATHVDDFIDDYANEVDAYARFFFLLHRLPAVLKADFHQFIAPYKLFCTYDSERWRVTGASRMGDVWLAKDFKREQGYDERVDLDKCSMWSDKP